MTASRGMCQRERLRAFVRAALTDGVSREECREAPPRERGREEGGEEPFGDFSQCWPASRRERIRIVCRCVRAPAAGGCAAGAAYPTYDTPSDSEFHPFHAFTWKSHSSESLPKQGKSPLD